MEIFVGAEIFEGESSIWKSKFHKLYGNEERKRETLI